MKKLLSILVLSFLFGGSASAEEPKNEYDDIILDEAQTYVLNNLQEDFTSCYSYYKIAEEGISRGREVDEKTLAGFKRSSDISLESAYLIGQQLGMKTEAMSARVKMSFARMQDEMGSEFINFSIILDKYGIFCRDLIEKTGERMKYWEDKFK